MSTSLARTPRVDLYAATHKALRLFLCETLGRIGRLDLGDAAECQAAFAQVEELMQLCLQHLVHEHQFLHTAIEARCPGGSTQVESEHGHHLEAIAGLRAEMAALRAAPGVAAAHRFYRHLALFVAESFEHMNVEETVHNPALWAAYSDAELKDIESQLIAALAPGERALLVRWLAPAVAPAERAQSAVLELR